MLGLIAFLSATSLASVVLCAPIHQRDIVFVTETLEPVYVTTYVGGASAGNADIQFSTQSAGDYVYSTVWTGNSKNNDDETSALAAVSTVAAEEVTSDVIEKPTSNIAEKPTSEVAAPAPANSEITPSNEVASSSEGPVVSTTDVKGDAGLVQSPTTSKAAEAIKTEITAVSTAGKAISDNKIQSVDSTTLVSTTSSAPVSSNQPATTSSTSNSQGKITALPNYMVYSPFTDSRQCKDYNTVLKDLTLIKSKGINKIRLYGVDCSAETTVLPAAAAVGLTVMQGLWIGTAGLSNVDSSLDVVIAYGKANGWGVFDRINVGNEDVLEGYVTAEQLISKMSEVKTKLTAAGFNGYVLTAEVTNVYQSNPSLCKAGDVIGVNIHSYFSPSFYAFQSGEFVVDQMNIVKSVCGSSNIFVTETGYPHAGDVNGNNIPTRANQVLAINSIMSRLNGEAVLLAQYDDFWKDPGKYNVENYFGTIDYIA